MALGDELRADDDVVVAARGRLELLRAAAPGRRENRRRAPADARRGTEALRLLGERARRRGRRLSGCRPRAGRADVRPLLDMAAMMADERLAKAMLDEPGRAVRALEAMAAGAAQGQRRVAAPVEEQQATVRPRASPASTPATRRGDSQRPRGGPSRRRSIAARSGIAPLAEPGVAASASDSGLVRR